MYSKQDIERLKYSISFEYLLESLGFENINIIKNRASCLLHSGSNKSSFSWNDETFYCFTCYCKGDKVSLIQQIMKCSFKESIEYLSGLTGIVLIDSNDKIKKKIVNYNNAEFPIKLVQSMGRRITREYFVDSINDTEMKIDKHVNILIKLKNKKQPELFSKIEYILNEFDLELSWLIYQRNQI